MKENTIIDSLGKLDDKLIERVDMLRQKGKRSLRMKWGAVAACLGLVLMGAVLWRQSAIVKMPGPGIVVDERGVTIPKLNVSLSADAAADMLGFFIYQGNCYVHYECFSDAADVVGEYLGTATGLIDEWTPKDGYVELAGSVKGDFYAVKGYGADFMLCMQHEPGEVAIYVRNTGLTLKNGSELYEDRLHLSGNYCGVSYETRESWYESREEVHRLEDIHMMEVAGFVEQLNQAEFMPWTTAAEQEGHTNSSIYDTEIYHVYFEMEDGTRVHLRLYENGYVRWQGLLDVCVQMKKESFDALIDVLDSPFA